MHFKEDGRRVWAKRKSRGHAFPHEFMSGCLSFTIKLGRTERPQCLAALEYEQLE